MRLTLLGDPNAEELILFFTGWAMDERPFRDLVPEGVAVAVIYDYRNLDLPQIPIGFSRIRILAWSLGVYAALAHLEKLPGEVCLVAGTGAFVHSELGIHPRVMSLTLEALEEKGEKVLRRFYEKMFAQAPEFERFLKAPPERTFAEVLEELRVAAERPPIFPGTRKRLKVFVPKEDAIIPSKVQRRFWERAGVPVQNLYAGHFPFYRFSSLQDLFALEVPEAVLSRLSPDAPKTVMNGFPSSTTKA